MVREAGVEPARPEWTLEPESSESTNSTTRAYSGTISFDAAKLLKYHITLVMICQHFFATFVRNLPLPTAKPNDKKRGAGPRFILANGLHFKLVANICFIKRPGQRLPDAF